MPPEFAHLHVHSDYSFLDGGASVKGLVARAKKLGMTSLALTDHGVMCGLMEFKRECEKADIKPILGSEIYVVPHDMHEKNMVGGKEYSHMVLLAENDVGYRNLTRIVSRAYTEGFYRKPRADYKTLAENSEGLICLTACLAGEIPQALMKEKYDDARCKVDTYVDIFGKDNVFLEVQYHKDSEMGTPELTVAGRMLELAKRTGVRPVLTNDSHYLNPEDFHAHNVLLCVNTGRLLTDPDRMEYGPDFYLKSPEEMQALFPSEHELLSNTMLISERCNTPLKRDQKYYLPRFQCPGGLDEESYIKQLCDQGLRKLYGDPLPADVAARYQFEFNTVKNMGFFSYFLITADFIAWAKNNGIPVGPGRGSAAGSIIAYALGITTVDPLKYNLLFERFLNPDRISMPDVDIDFCVDRRGEVIDYVRNKYGHEAVCQIGTFSKLLSRAVLKDVGRVLSVPLATVNGITKKIEVKQGKVPKIDEILKSNDELRSEYENDSEIHRLWDTARTLEGLTRGTGVHAAGVVIAPSDVSNYLPLMTQSEDGAPDRVIATQYPMADVEDQGLLKMDFLGLRNLTIIDQALRMIEKDTGERIDINALSLDDLPTYETLSSGEGFGIFQLESEGMCRLLKSVKPTTFEDISAVLAIYRPGPLSAGVDKSFAKRKNGEEPAHMPGEAEGLASAEAVEKLKKILSDTYGLLIYQEQAMLMSRELGGFSPGEADNLRKAIGKKNADLMNKLRPKFIEGCGTSGYGEELGTLLWDLMEGFGAYGFNKAHTVCYGMISYQTAWLKTNYPAQYAAALISSQIGNNDKIIDYVRGVRGMGVDVLPPDINRSQASFSTAETTDDEGVTRRAVVFGLSGMKGAGTKAIDHILEQRQKAGGRFKGFLHFLENIDTTIVTKAVLETLVRGGVFDSLGMNRPSLLAALETCIRVSAAASEDARRGQSNLFGGGGGGQPAQLSEADEQKRDRQTIATQPDWTDAERQRAEKDTFGFFISSSPLDTNIELLKRYTTHTTAEAAVEKPNRQVVLGGLLRGLRVTKIQKDGSRNYGRTMARFVVEDFEGSVPITVFPDDYDRFQELLIEDTLVFLRGFTKESMQEGADIELTVAEVVPASMAEARFANDPLITHGRWFSRYSRHKPDDLLHLAPRSETLLAGVVMGRKHIRTKKDKDMLIFNLVSRDGRVKILAMNGREPVFDRYAELCQEGAAVVVRGQTSIDDRGEVGVFATEVLAFAVAQQQLTEALCLKLAAEEISRPLLENLRELVLRYSGSLPFYFKVVEGGELVGAGNDAGSGTGIPAGEDSEWGADGLVRDSSDGGADGLVRDSSDGSTSIPARGSSASNRQDGRSLITGPTTEAQGLATSQAIAPAASTPERVELVDAGDDFRVSADPALFAAIEEMFDAERLEVVAKR